MKKGTQTRITVETERLIVIGYRSNLAAWCRACGANSRWLTVEEAGRAAGLRDLAVYHLVEAGALHYAETPAGALFVCAASLWDLNSTWKG